MSRRGIEPGQVYVFRNGDEVVAELWYEEGRREYELTPWGDTGHAFGVALELWPGAMVDVLDGYEESDAIDGWVEWQTRKLAVSS